MSDLILRQVSIYLRIGLSIAKLKSGHVPLRWNALRKVISSLLRRSSWLHLAKTYRWIWLLLSRQPLWRMARSIPSRLPRKGRPSPAWASETPRMGEMIPNAVCQRWRRISAADRHRIPRRRISSPRNHSYCRSCSSATGKVCLRRKCSFKDRESERANAILD